MAWRFKASKYKNAAPIVPKLEVCVRDICVGSYQTYGNNIAASAAFMAFNWDHAGSSLAVLPIDDCGRKSKTMPLLHAHSDTVTDLDFSPFHDGILATGSQDCLVKIWNIPQEGLQESMCTPECIFSHKQRRVESVGFHPTVGCMLHSASFTTLAIWDVAAQQEMFSNADHSDVIQSVSWKRDGSLMSTSCKDKMVRVIDPRSMKPLTLAASSHQSIKDSRVVWLGDQTKILTTGFDSSRLRQIIIRDIRKFCEPEKTLELDCSTGILMPLFDPDTRMLFLCGKGDSTILYMETIDNEPYLIEGIRHSGEQTKGACLAPKRALRVMEGEVNRVLQLTSSAVIPIMYQVPRKSYRDYHGDLFPDTPGPVSINTPDKWKAGSNLPVPLISLNPKNRVDVDHPILVQNGTFEDLCKKNHSSISTLQSDILTSVVPNSDLETSNNESKIDINPVRDLVIDMERSNPEEKLNNPKLDGIEVCVEIRNGSPPKPLPRASRTGSLSESIDEVPKPVARPRTSTTPSQTRTITAFKPRLGPKPFSTVNRSEEFSFDKVFSVPNVPGNDTNGDFVHITENTDTNRSPQHDLSESPASDVEDGPTRFSGEGEYNNSKYDTSSQEEEPNSDSLNKASTPPSTTERRKLFEIQSNSKEDDDSIDKLESFERSSLQRSSIAERRRLYENRSQSVQEPTSIEKSGSPVPFKRRDSLKNRKDEKDIDQEKRQYARQQSHEPHLLQKVTEPVVQVTPPKRTSTVFGRVSKFRHLKGTAGHKSTHIENVRNISRQISGECDGFQANPERVAVPLSGAGGKVAVFELSRTGKVPDGVIPALVHGSNIMDFQWDPFNHQRLAVACDDGIIRLWSIPETGLSEPTNIPETELNAHSDKIYFIKFHPTAQDVLATGSHDMSIKIWDLNMLVCNIILKGHIEQMFSFAWSPCGQFCATVSKDSKIRVYYPRSKDLPIHEGPGPVGSRGARIVWALEGRYLVVMGFDKVSERQIMIFSCTNLSTPLSTVSLDVSPAILIPFYDEDSSTLFLTGKGDTTIYVFEVTDEAPYLCALSHHRCSSIHQGLSFLPKNTCDVASVEFAKALRLTNNAIEPLSFTVPRIKNDLFQDDLFPPTRVTWKPIMSASQWFCGTNKSPKRYSLQPEGMDCLSSSQGSTEILKKSPSIIKNNAMNDLSGNAWTHFTVQSAQKKKQDEIQKSVSNRLPLNLKLEQDDMEGVDEKEWEE